MLCTEICLRMAPFDTPHTASAKIVLDASNAENKNKHTHTHTHTHIDGYKDMPVYGPS